MLKKRGLSTIVTTLVIILVTLVAIGVIWVIVNNILQKGAEEVELGQYTLDLQIKAAQIQNGNITVVVVRRNPGEGDFIGMNFIFSDGQNSEIIRQNISLKELEEKSFTFTLTKLNTANLKTISVAPIFKTESGKESVGDVSDMFDVKKGGSISGGAVSGPKVNNFAALGFTGAGAITYTISANAGIYPQFISVTVDPVDVNVGDNQTFTVVVYSLSGIANVTTTTQLDTQVLNLPLQKISESGGTETWSATWSVYDTHIEVYRTTFTATDNAGNKNNVSLTWTDDCSNQFVHGAATSLVSVPCTITSTEGADSSNIVISSGTTLTLNSSGVLAYTPGYSVSKSGTGKIAFSGGSITKKYVFYYDADNDLVSTNTTLIASANSALNGSGFIRPISALNTTDCDDTSSVVSLTRTLYKDNDTDGYFVVNASFCASSSTWGTSACNSAGTNYSKNSSNSCVRITLNGTADCYDANANAKPGATSFFTSVRGSANDSAGNIGNSYDYDCDSSITTLPSSYTDAGPGCDWTATPSCSVPPGCEPGQCGPQGSTINTGAGDCGTSINSLDSCTPTGNQLCAEPCASIHTGCQPSTSSPTVSCR